jgi:hypothetical protein
VHKETDSSLTQHWQCIAFGDLPDPSGHVASARGLNGYDVIVLDREHIDDAEHVLTFAGEAIPSFGDVDERVAPIA